MSTPTEKPINPIDPFVHVPHETHGRGGREHHPIESDGEPIRSPYAPAKARERAGAEGDPGQNDPPWSPYAPKKARTQSVQAPHVAMTESAAPIAPPWRPGISARTFGAPCSRRRIKYPASTRSSAQSATRAPGRRTPR